MTAWSEGTFTKSRQAPRKKIKRATSRGTIPNTTVAVQSHP